MLQPPIEPMLAKIADELPQTHGFLFEPKWDGFRALVFRNGAEAYLQSRDLRPLNRYFPELEKALAQAFPPRAALDGVIAKPEATPYLPGKRAMLKIKHARTAECVVAGFRWYRDTQDAVGSLLLGLYDDAGVLHHVGVTSSFTMAMRRELAARSSTTTCKATAFATLPPSCAGARTSSLRTAATTSWK